MALFFGLFPAHDEATHCSAPWQLPTRSAEVTPFDCDLISLAVNIDSQPNAISLCHPGGYLTSPTSANVMHWQLPDAQGAFICEATLTDENFVEFTHEAPLTDSIFASVLLPN